MKETKWLIGFIGTITILFPLLLNLALGLSASATGLGNVVNSQTIHTKATQDGCAIKIETTEKVEWKMPRQPVDLVILQDTSGSFVDTIDEVQAALKKLTTPLADGEKYDETNPKLVFTNDPKTTDRVMINTYRGIDVTRYTSRFIPSTSGNYQRINQDVYYPGYKIYSNGGYYFVPNDDYNPINLNGIYARGTIVKNGVGLTPEDDYARTAFNIDRTDSDYAYNFTKTPLLSSQAEIDKAINSFHTNGGTPTVPAIDDTIAEYNKIKGDMANNRKTVFLLITDGVANGYRGTDGRVYIDRSLDRTGQLINDWANRAADGSYVWPELAQPYLTRAEELKAKGAELKAKLGDDATVVVGFWEDQAQFTVATGYFKAYLNDFGTPDIGTTLNTGDNRSVRKVFDEAIRSVASPDRVLPTGEKASFYVNEQNIDRFSEKILKAVTSALVKEDVQGEFTVTEGYKVESVTINKKKVVSEVKNPETEIRGTVKQDGRKVTIAVPESVFNPGNNDFDYELKRVEEAENLSEADETEPPADYTPQKVQREVGQLVGKFKVGDYESAEIGSKDPVNVEVTDLKYCYPRVTKDVKDANISNDTNGDDGKTGNLAEDPLLKASEPSISRPTYAATLSDQGEAFTYTVRYNMYNIPLEMDKNVMLVDKLDYRIDYQDAYVTDADGNKLNNFTIASQDVQDGSGNNTKLIYATVPQSKGVQTTTVNEGEYGGHKFKVYNLVIKAKIKDEYTFERNENVYKSMMTENGGLGFYNQAQIVWNGNTADPQDKTAQTRRSNAVYVVPPVKTDITKKVSQTIKDNGEEHLELPTRLDEYYYQINSTWPGLFDNYIIEDVLVPELMSLNDSGEDKVFVNGKESTTLTKYLKKETVEVAGEKRDRVFFELDATKLSKLTLRRINTEIENLNKGNSNPPVITLGIKARIRDNSVLARYADNNGKILVPNTAKVTLNGTPKESNKVTVSPNSPAAAKRINKDKESLVTGIDPDSGEGEIFEYDVFATLPNDINQAHEYVIKDVIDERLELINFDKLNAPVRMVDVDAEHFDVEVKTEDVNGKQQNVVYSRMKSTSFKSVKAGDVVHMVIRARVKKGATGTIENTVTVYYNGKPTPPTPPVTVTPPPPVEKEVKPTVMSREAGEADGVPQGTYTAKINKPGEDIEIAVWNDPYVYTVKSVVPKGAYRFTIEDTVIPEMDIEDTISDTYPRKVEITTDNGIVTIPAEQVKVDKQNLNKQTISVTLTEEQIKEYAEKPIVLTFTAKFKAGASLTEYLDQASGLPKAPNTATIQVDNKPKVKSNTVTVTPPINEPEIKKKVQDKEHHDLTGRYELFKYSIQTTMPYNAKDFTVSDILEPVLHLASPIEQITVKVGDHTYTGEDLKEIVKVTEEKIDGATHPVVTASFVEKHIKNNESKPILIEFLAQVNNEADLTKYRYVKENHSEKYGDDTNHAEIPNVASYKIGNRIRKESNKVTVTPPPPTPSKITKKIEDVYSKTDPKPLVDHLNVENEKDYNYVVDTVLPSNIFEYKSWRMEDTLDPRLELSKKEQPFIVAVHDDGQPATEEDQKYIDDHFKLSIVDVSVNGQPTKKIIVTVPENKMKTLHDKYHLRLYIPAHIKAGVKDKRIPNEAVKIGVKPNNEEHILSTPPVTVTPPDETPTPKKTVDDQESLNLASLGQEFTYRVKVTVPENIVGMTKFEISDDLEDILTAKEIKVLSAGKEDKAIKVTGVADANKAKGLVTATIAKDDLPKYAGKEISLEIKARIKEDVKGEELAKYVTADNTAGSIPNKATLTVGDKPSQKKETEEVPVTPPGDTPNVSKKVNETLDSAVVLPEADYTYNIKSTLPKDISTYKKFNIVDEVDDRLAVKGTPVIKGEAAKFFKVTVTGQTVTAEITDFEAAKAYAAKEVELIITAQVKKDATVKEDENGIPNQAKVQYRNKSRQDGEPDEETPPTPPVTVTPPPLTKKINDTLDHLDIPSKEDYKYNIKTTIPTDIVKYKKFVITDTLDKDLMVKGTPSITGDAAKFFDVKVDGQTVTATMKDFAK
ncbi:isopeptide-forming domain-containing fimbrial protein, partial [Streptococcus sp. S784/96/1]|uniref:isopeptide-forming domain-containing fimbrial protein n=1 Tax=Streptococcus sp. S784/96/1 TaxID=2653499 RepID=UPI001389AC37